MLSKVRGVQNSITQSKNDLFEQVKNAGTKAIADAGKNLLNSFMGRRLLTIPGQQEAETAWNHVDSQLKDGETAQEGIKVALHAAEQGVDTLKTLDSGGFMSKITTFF